MTHRTTTTTTAAADSYADTTAAYAQCTALRAVQRHQIRSDTHEHTYLVAVTAEARTTTTTTPRASQTSKSTTRPVSPREQHHDQRSQTHPPAAEDAHEFGVAAGHLFAQNAQPHRRNSTLADHTSPLRRQSGADEPRNSKPTPDHTHTQPRPHAAHCNHHGHYLKLIFSISKLTHRRRQSPTATAKLLQRLQISPQTLEQRLHHGRLPAAARQRKQERQGQTDPVQMYQYCG